MPACSGTLIRQNVVLTAAHCMCYSYYPQDNPANGIECVNGGPGKPKSPMLDPSRWRKSRKIESNERG
jgi:V8-like Glu-specific endopeptidase